MTNTATSNLCDIFFRNLQNSFGNRGSLNSDAGSVQKTAEAANTASSSGPETTQSACCPPPNWMPIAIGEIGVTERSGAAANPRILEYFEAARFWGTDDSGGANAWCASLVAYVMKAAGYGIATDAFRAREWQNRWSDGVDIGRPIYGAIAVKSRTGGGHVGFVMGRVPGTTDKLAILGGNQGNTTNVREYPESDFLAFMVPTSYQHSCCVLTDYSGTIVGGGSES